MAENEQPTVAADAALAEQNPEGPSESLEAQAEAQRAEQAAELKAGKKGVTPAEKELIELVKVAPAGPRVGHGASTPTVHGKMDNMSVRSYEDALEGHFVTIDPSVKGVEDAYRDARLIRDEGDERGEYKHTGYYGVYMQPGAIDPKTGIPVSAVVRLRDDTNALVNVPYEALSRAQAGGR